MAKNDLVEEIKTNDVLHYIDFFERTFRYNLQPFIEYCKAWGKKRLDEFEYYDSSRIWLCTRTFQNYKRSNHEDDKKLAVFVSQMIQEDIISECSVKPKYIVENLNITPDTLNDHSHVTLFFPKPVRKAELIKLAPWYGFEAIPETEFAIDNVLRHSEEREDHEEVILNIVWDSDDEGNLFLKDFKKGFVSSEHKPKIKRILGMK